MLRKHGEKTQPPERTMDSWTISTQITSLHKVHLSVTQESLVLDAEGRLLRTNWLEVKVGTEALSSMHTLL